MKVSNKLTLVFLTSLGVIYPTLSVNAEIETTTVRTTTVSAGDPGSNVLEKRSTTTTETKTVVPEGRTISLPATTTYVIVDPVTGVVRGNFDPMRTVVDVKTISLALL